jgi:hypothetical protein
MQRNLLRGLILRAEYDARVDCANRIAQSLRDVNLPDMTQAPALLKSMIDTIEGDIKGVSAAHADLVHFAESIDSSRKALLTIGKIHQTMCGTNQIAKVTPADQGSTPLSSVEQLTGPRTVAECEKAGMKWDGNTAACTKSD